MTTRTYRFFLTPASTLSIDEAKARIDAHAQLLGPLAPGEKSLFLSGKKLADEGLFFDAHPDAKEFLEAAADAGAAVHEHSVTVTGPT